MGREGATLEKALDGYGGGKEKDELDFTLE